MYKLVFTCIQYYTAEYQYITQNKRYNFTAVIIKYCYKMIFSQEVKEELSNLIQSSVRMVLKETQPETVELINQPEQFLSIQEASAFLNLTVPTLYSKVSKGELPVMKRSKRLYFSRTELMDYLKKGRKRSNSEIEAEAVEYLNKKRLNNGK